MASKTRIWIRISLYILYMQGSRNSGCIEVQAPTTGAWRPIVAMKLKTWSATKHVWGHSQKWIQIKVDYVYHFRYISGIHMGTTQIFRSGRALAGKTSVAAVCGVQANPSSRINCVLAAWSGESYTVINGSWAEGTAAVVIETSPRCSCLTYLQSKTGHAARRKSVWSAKSILKTL